MRIVRNFSTIWPDATILKAGTQVQFNPRWFLRGVLRNRETIRIEMENCGWKLNQQCRHTWEYKLQRYNIRIDFLLAGSAVRNNKLFFSFAFCFFSVVIIFMTVYFTMNSINLLRLLSLLNEKPQLHNYTYYYELTLN